MGIRVSREWYNASMNQGRKLFGVVFFAATTNVAFWVIYSTTGNVVSSIGITAGVSIGLSVVLYKLGQIDKRIQPAPKPPWDS